MTESDQDEEAPDQRAQTLFLESVRDDPELGVALADALGTMLEVGVLEANQLVALLGGEP